MDVNIKRFYITKERKNHFVAVDHRRKKYKILKNEYSKKFRINDDGYIYYTVFKKGLFNTVITPISHQEFLEMNAEAS
jgi:hypothetical protein